MHFVACRRDRTVYMEGIHIFKFVFKYIVFGNITLYFYLFFEFFFGKSTERETYILNFLPLEGFKLLVTNFKGVYLNLNSRKKFSSIEIVIEVCG